jgi:zona occludens toxin (predicted ATPase)
MKKWIDNASYEDLFRKWRFAPTGDLFFQDEMGRYFKKVMLVKRMEVGDREHTRVSKKIGWER